MANSDDAKQTQASAEVGDWRTNDPALNRGAFISMIAGVFLFVGFLVLQLSFGG